MSHLYMNADDIPKEATPSLPPKMKKKSTQEVVYEKMQPPARTKAPKTKYSAPALGRPEDVVYADVSHVSKSKNKHVALQEEEVLYADISILEKRMADARVKPQMSMADQLDADSDAVVYADIVDIQKEAREKKEKEERERREKERREKEKRERAKPNPTLPDRAYKEKGKGPAAQAQNYTNVDVTPPAGGAKFEPGVTNAPAKWYNAPADTDMRVILAHEPPSLVMYSEATHAVIHTWATNTLRGFGQKGKTFAFEAGRRSSTGEGFYKYTIDDSTDFQESLKSQK